MRCDDYDGDLIDCAAGAAASSGLEAHLGDCLACRQRLATQHELLAAFDRSLRTRLATEPSPAVLERVASGLATPQATTFSSRRGMAAFAACLATAVVVGGILSRPSPVAAPVVTAATEPAPKVARRVGAPSEMSPSEVATAVLVMPRRAPHATSRPARVLSEVRREPEVLVPPGQEEALRQFVISLRNDPRGSRPLLRAAASVEDAVEAPPPLDIPPLDGGAPPHAADPIERSDS